PERPQQLLAVLDVDVADQGKPEEAHRLLAVDERDHAAAAPAFPAAEEANALQVQEPALRHGGDRRDQEQEPEEVARVQAQPLTGGVARACPCSPASGACVAAGWR